MTKGIVYSGLHGQRILRNFRDLKRGELKTGAFRERARDPFLGPEADCITGEAARINCTGDRSGAFEELCVSGCWGR